LPAPSFSDHVLQRGFHHLDEILLPLGITLLHVFYKNKAYRQAEQDVQGRQGIREVIQRHQDMPLPRKMILFDDVMTSGETMRSMIQLIPIHERYDLKIMVLSRKIDTNSRLQSASKMLK
jgi:predicted amidophosphoribosyltransferase